VTIRLSPRLRVTAIVEELHSPVGATVNETSCSDGVSWAVTDPDGSERKASARRCRATVVDSVASVRTLDRMVMTEGPEPREARVRTRSSTCRVPAGSRRLAEKRFIT
jgi:hypothetical protein